MLCQPSAFYFPSYPGTGNRLLKGKEKDGVLKLQTEDEGGWKRVEITFSGGFGGDKVGGRTRHMIATSPHKSL